MGEGGRKPGEGRVRVRADTR